MKNCSLSMRLETVGDLMGVIIALCNSKVIIITGERSEDNMLKEDTMRINTNPVLKGHVDAYIKGDDEKGVSLDDISFSVVKSLILPDLLLREKVNYNLNP